MSNTVQLLVMYAFMIVVIGVVHAKLMRSASRARIEKEIRRIPEAQKTAGLQKIFVERTIADRARDKALIEKLEKLGVKGISYEEDV